MRAGVVIGLAAAASLLLQTTVFHALPFGQSAPDILLVLCVYLGLHHYTVGGSIGAFLIGYAQDSASGSAAGLNAFGMVAVFLFAYLTCRRLWVDNLPSKVVLVFLASLVNTVVVVVLLAIFASFHGPWASVLWSLFFKALLTAAIAPPVFGLLANAGLSMERE